MQRRPTEAARALVDGEVERYYVLWFQEPGVAEAEMDPKARLIFERLMRGGTDPAELTRRTSSGA